jgi:hypothetical protein
MLSSARFGSRSGMMFSTPVGRTLFSAAAPCAARWPELLACGSEGVWNLYSAADEMLDRYYSDSVGLDAFQLATLARETLIAHVIDCHRMSAYCIEHCLRRAGFQPSHLQS